MKITLEPTHEGTTGPNPNPTITITLPGDSHGLAELMDDLIEPALKAYGFHGVRQFLSQYYSDEP